MSTRAEFDATDEARRAAPSLLEAIGVRYEVDLERGLLLALAGQVEALLGAPAGRWLAPGGWAELVSPSDRARVQATLNRAGAGGTFDLAHEVIAANGATSAVRNVGRVTSAGRVEGLLLPAGPTAPGSAWPGLSASLLLKALDALVDPFILKDAAHRLLFVNRATCELMRIPREQFLARPVQELIAPETLAAFQAEDDRALASEAPTTIEVTLPDSTGQQHLILETKTSFSDDEGRRFVVAAIRDVSLRSRLERERERGSAFLAELLDTIADPIFVKDEQHRWVLINRAFCDFMGRPRAELMNHSDYDFFPREEADVFWAQDELAFRSGEVNENEEFLTDARGRRHIILTKKKAFTDTEGRRVVVGVIRDITERREAELALRQSEERFRTIFTQGPLGMAVLDLDLRLRRVNEMLCRMLAADEPDLVGRALRELTHSEDRSRGDDTSELLLSGDLAFQKSERRFLRRDGGVLWGSLTLSVICDLEGEPLHFLAMVEDVGERKRAEVALLQARDTALHSAQAKSRFLATVSHEIRTPLNAVIGMTSLLLDSPLAFEQRECVELIRSSGDALLTLLNDILDFSKLESDRMELERQPFDVRDCVEESLDLVAARAAEKGLELTYLVAPSAPARIIGDTTRLRQVLVNLLSNAVKFTDRGEVRLEVTSRPLEGRLHEVRFVVSDTGIGIPAERLQRLFLSFSQVDASTTRHFGGTGLGLAISRSLVELMGGRVDVHSVDGQGSSFVVSIVAAEEEAPPRLSPATDALAGRQLLVVASNATTRQLIVQQAGSWRMVARAAATPEEALAHLRDAAQLDVILLDRDLPGCAPDDVATDLRAARPGSSPPIVLLTPMGKAGSRRLRGLFQGQLTKPVKLGQLRALLVALLTGELQHAGAVVQRIDTELGRRAPLRILVVDDNVVNQKVAVRLLERMGYQADVAGSGMAALAAVHRQPYDLLLLDAQMPGMDGAEVARRIRRAFAEDRRPRLVALTADALHGDRERCLAAGMDDFVSKPVRVEELQAALLRCAEAPGRAAPEAAPEADPPVDPDVFDEEVFRRLRLLCPQGTEGAGLELYALLLADAPPTVEALREAVAAGDAPTVVRLSHGLRGSCANLGARAMLLVTARLEEQARAGELRDAPALLADLSDALERTRAAVAGRAGPTPGGDASPVS
jgi:PAS domain S-box-containing protein